MLWPFFTYYGGKWRSARKYPEPVHDVVIEPFAGSAGYSLRYADRRVLLIDLNPTIAELWQYLIEADPDRVLSLPDIPHGYDVRDLDVLPAERSLIGFWLNKGTCTPRYVPSQWFRTGKYATQMWGPEIRQRIASQLESIRHWEVALASYAQLADCDATYFIDPPYQGPPGRRYPYNEIDFDHLAQWCRSRSGQVIVCENVGADWLPFAPLHDSKSLKAVSHEAIWMST